MAFHITTDADVMRHTAQRVAVATSLSVVMTVAILTGGWFGRRGRRRMRRSAREQLGLILACLWACTGLYLLGLLYWIDIFRDQ